MTLAATSLALLHAYIFQLSIYKDMTLEYCDLLLPFWLKADIPLYVFQCTISC